MKVTHQIVGENVVLTPYLEEHVRKYHEWMSDEQMLYLTGSERLTLDEEFEMQKKWLLDENKCTFIILHKDTFRRTQCAVDAMIGDTNIFVHEQDVGEIEVMIAEREFRGKGLATEATRLMLRFGAEVLRLKRFEAKIKYDNAASMALFTKLGFKEEGRSDVFQEVTYRLSVGKGAVF